MKSLFGKILAGAAGVVAVLGMSAFAADITLDTPVVKDKAAGTVTISGTITGDAASKEATILVVPEGQSLVGISDENIKYINQETAAEGKFSFDFALATNAKYVVYVGGTEVAAPDDGEIDLTASEEPDDPEGFKIVGTVTILADADMSKVTAVADDISGTVAADGAYTIEVAPGTYTVVVGRPGYLYRTFADVEVSDADVDLGATALLAGDIVLSDPANISLADLQALLAAYNTTSADDNFDELADFNDDQMITLIDLQALLTNYNSVASDYDA